MEETKYSVADFASQSRNLFDTTPEVVTVALQEAGIDMATKEEAERTIKAFLEKEVN